MTRLRPAIPAPAATLLLLASVLFGLGPGTTRLHAQVPPGTLPKPPPGFDLTRWAREPMLRSPVALAFDDQGRLYVAETARRSTVDIDIRSHPTWVVDDLSNQSVDDLRRFFRARMAPDLSTANASWLKDLNQDGSHDWQDLTQVKERIDLLEDSDGSGHATRARVFAEDFHEEITGVLAGVLPWQNDVFATVYPDLWRLTDTNADGIADRRESVFRGFGVHAAFDGHDLHGLTPGPDGKIYFSVGDNGFSVTNREGRRLHHPNTGGVLRMNPDGSDLEVFATGLRNPQEIAFDDLGNLFTVDNDGDLADERERFVFIAEGSDSGWRLHWQFRESGWARHTRQPDYNPWIAERLWVPHFPGQPAHITPPLTNYSVGPGSFVYNPGTALTDAYRGHFFLIQFPVAKVTAFQTRPHGAGFDMVNEHTFVSGMMASSLAFSPDGALAIGDWDGLWSPSGRGSIWRVDSPEAARSSLRREVRDKLAAGPRNRPTQSLLDQLAHPDRRLRLQAQSELVRRGELQPLHDLATRPTNPSTPDATLPLARIHALWALGQAHAFNPKDLPSLEDPDARIRAQAARMAGNARLAAALPALLRNLADADATVRYHAAMAVGKLGDPRALDALVRLLESNADADPFLRHAAILGLAGSVPASSLATLHAHPSPAVRRAAVIALRRLHAPSVASFLSDPNPAVRHDAVRAIHDDDAIPDALPALAHLGNDPELSRIPGMMRRILSAQLRLGTPDAANRLLRHTTDPSLDTDLRIEALSCLVHWNTTPAFDRVQGFIRPLGPRDPGLGHQRVREAAATLAREPAPQPLMAALLNAILEHGIAVDSSLYAGWAVSDQHPPARRAQALELVARHAPDRLQAALTQALDAPQPVLRLTALRLLAERNPEAFVSRASRQSQTWPIPDRQAAIRLATAIPGPAAHDWIATLLTDLSNGRLAPELALDVLEAATARTEPDLRARTASFDTPPAPDQPTPRQRTALHGGDPGRGRDLFQSHPNAQCVRCHDAGGEGQQVGPVLKGLAARVPPEYLLEAVLQPSARIADGFATTSLTLRNGDEIDGVRIAETPEELSLRLVNGSVRRFNRRDILHLNTSSVSTMPPMGTVLTPFELRDLLAYLRTLQ